MQQYLVQLQTHYKIHPKLHPHTVKLNLEAVHRVRASYNSRVAERAAALQANRVLRGTAKEPTAGIAHAGAC
eukprot:2941560-Pleurochrysis_carterae.AAC.5